jgi:hypothetical protein
MTFTDPFDETRKLHSKWVENDPIVDPDKKFFTSPRLYFALAAAALAAFISNSCLQQRVPPSELETALSDPVQIHSQELDPWKTQYMVDGKLDGEELSTMADHFFWDHAYKFAVGDPNYVPRAGDFEVTGTDGYTATIDWSGKEYSFCLEDDWSGAELYEN